MFVYGQTISEQAPRCYPSACHISRFAAPLISFSTHVKEQKKGRDPPNCPQPFLFPSPCVCGATPSNPQKKRYRQHRDTPLASHRPTGSPRVVCGWAPHAHLFLRPILRFCCAVLGRGMEGACACVGRSKQEGQVRVTGMAEVWCYHRVLLVGTSR